MPLLCCQAQPQPGNEVPVVRQYDLHALEALSIDGQQACSLIGITPSGAVEEVPQSDGEGQQPDRSKSFLSGETVLGLLKEHITADIWDSFVRADCASGTLLLIAPEDIQ